MKRISKITLFAAAAMFVSNSFAQISDRVNNPSQFKIGTRPVKGNLGIFFAISSDNVKTWIAKEDKESETKTHETILPIVNMKYYLQDNLVFRCGVQTSKKKSVTKGDIDPVVNGPGLTFKEDVSVASDFFITPAIEKHFLNSNLLDPYIEVGIPLGYLREKEVHNEKYDYGDLSEQSMTKNSFAYGIEAHLGIQAFIADLPLAIGAEFGFYGIGYRGDKYKHIDNATIGGLNATQTYYTFKNDPLNNRYSSLKSNDFDLSGSARVTISYYFSK